MEEHPQFSEKLCGSLYRYCSCTSAEMLIAGLVVVSGCLLMLTQLLAHNLCCCSQIAKTLRVSCSLSRLRAIVSEAHSLCCLMGL